MNKWEFYYTNITSFVLFYSIPIITKRLSRRFYEDFDTPDIFIIIIFVWINYGIVS